MLYYYLLYCCCPFIYLMKGSSELICLDFHYCKDCVKSNVHGALTQSFSYANIILFIQLKGLFSLALFIFI